MRQPVLQNGCDINGQSYSGNTALHSACGRDQVDTVRLLLKNGADSSLKNYHNDTPVMVTKNKKVSKTIYILFIQSSLIPFDFMLLYLCTDVLDSVKKIKEITGTLLNFLSLSWILPF